MSLYEDWFKKAYTRDGKTNEKLWDLYIPQEQRIYEYILDNRLTVLEGKLKELAEKFDMSPDFFVGFIDGINDTQNPRIELENLKEDTDIKINIDFEVLYKKMVEYKAEHLYNLPQWREIYTEDQLKVMYKGQKSSKTYIRETKVGRNELCPCGSGKKYKKCCGAN